MPTGPEGQKRPAGVIANAVHVAKIATGEAKEIGSQPSRPETRQQARRRPERGKEAVLTPVRV